GVGFAPALTTALAPGLAPDTRALTVVLMRLLFPMSGLMVLSAWCLGVLNTHRRFFLPYAAPALWNVTAIVALAGAGTWLVSPALPLDEQLGRLALALAWGTVAGGVLQVAVQLPVCWRLLPGIALRVSTAPAGGSDGSCSSFCRRPSHSWRWGRCWWRRCSRRAGSDRATRSRWAASWPRTGWACWDRQR